MDEKTQRPEHTIRRGFIHAKIWRNEPSNGNHYYRVTVDRLIRDGDGWKRTSVYDVSDLGNVALAAGAAAAWVSDKEALERETQRTRQSEDAPF